MQAESPKHHEPLTDFTHEVPVPDQPTSSELAAPNHLTDAAAAGALALEANLTTPELPSTARIWVGSLAEDGELQGEWIDANKEPAQLHAEVLRILNASAGTETKESGIFDYQGFGGHRIEEFEQLTSVIALAQGTEQHGPAFAAWASYLGPDQLDRLDSFQDHYLGHWPSLRAYVESYLDDIGFAYDLEQAVKDLPASLSRHVKLDIDALTNEWKQHLHVVAHQHGVWLFQP